MTFEIVTASKKDLETELLVRRALAKERPGMMVEAIESDGDLWNVRLVTADLPPFLKKKDDKKDDSDSDSADDNSNDEDDGADDDSDDDSDDSDSDSDDDGKDDKTTDGLVGELRGLVEHLQDVVKQISDKGEEVNQKAEEHKDRADKAKDILDQGAESDGPPMPPGGVGPTPGKPPLPGGPRPPMRPGGPGLAPGGGIPAFTHKKTEIVTHPGTDKKGERISLVAAAAELQEDEDFAAYEVIGMTENSDGTYSAKLRLK